MSVGSLVAQQRVDTCGWLVCGVEQFMQRPKEEQLKAKIRAEQQRKMKESHWVLREESTRFVCCL